ncbi:alpha/beta-hydrolase family protein [Rhodococcus artemisiae]|uniref:Alpha/beta-hydrolase family protein n=1 Tax=Rhodococcus artemisiae TaxID=714159 RepID=A0ABU7L8N1_9NOCA|nr:alpha/beta-hydrolase family protein [Rhodococcus artemisiae]MEE2057682.1 alpha/beta-hydrolase family protein [Rhodococcus artemisiae]
MTIDLVHPAPASGTPNEDSPHSRILLPHKAFGPRLGSTAAATLAAVVSLAPSLLPRASLTQGVLTGVLIAVALALMALGRRVVPHRVRARYGPCEAEAGWLAAAVAAAMVAVSATWAHHWQNALRAAMDVPPIGFRYWLEVLAGTVVTATVLVGGAAGIRALIRMAGRARSVATLAAVTILLGWGATSIASPSPDTASASASTPVATLAPGMSGSPISLVNWNSLGTQGRRFVSIESSGSPVRVYVGLAAAADDQSRAALAVRELERTGGFEREHLVVAIPTGSGWVDANAVQGFEDRWGDDVAIAAQQYSDTPSWVTFVFDRDAASRSARALVSAVRTHIATMPPGQRPDLHVYGQSLGSIGGSAAFDDIQPGPCDALWAGPPAGSVRTDGATVSANTSDPVVWWQPSLLWSPPDLSRAVQDAPVPTWLPVVGFLQTTVDLFTSLDSAAGHGHRYGPEQAQCEPAVS